MSYRLLPLLLLAWLALPAQAWDPAIHGLVGEIAWLDLEPAVRRSLLACLQSHPDPQVRTLAQACEWPDVVKHTTRQDTASWHYINLPWSPDGTAAPAPRVPNLLTVIPQLEAELRAGRSLAENLSFYGHLIGDLHQPLHALSAYSREHPHGDRGGADVILPSGLNLHHFWDGVAGLEVGPDRVLLAQQLRAVHSRASYPELADPDLEHWVQESYRLGVAVAYAWPGAPEPTRAAGVRRLVLAGYRLADRLNQLLPSP